MLGLLFLIPIMPLAGFLLLGPFGPRLPRRTIAVIGVGSIFVSTVIAILVAISFLTAPPAGHAYTQQLWTWLNVAGFAPGITFHLDSLALVMVLVVSFVSLLIHLYSTEFMWDEEGYSRFFAYMNLFVGSMLTLVLADNLLLLYLGWEGVGLCSYLLIGFWYKDPANGRAARKAFIVTRVGDTSLAIGLFLLFTSLGTLDIQPLLVRAAQHWTTDSTIAIAAAALILGGAVGKSAQLPLQTWLPDAMAGPTPVSALIHAATMVTAGVYLIARLHVLFTLAPDVQAAVAAVGAATLLLAGFSALTQSDIKRVLAYSTISQIGYMFLALGVGAWSAAIFHFMTHAFFKALLFLGAGAISMALHHEYHEYDMFKMGGLRRQLPLVFWTFLLGSASLSALPLVTAGFYSKDLILWQAWSSQSGAAGLWAAGIVGALLTSIYTFRMVFLVFFGPVHTPATRRPGIAVRIPLVTLAVLAILAGFLSLPAWLGNHPWFTDFVQQTLPAPVSARGSTLVEGLFALIAAVIAVLGVYLAYLFILQRRDLTERAARAPVGAALHRFWFVDWGLDWLYDRVFVWPYAWLAAVDRTDIVDRVYAAAAWLSRLSWSLLRRTETGGVRWYAFAIAAGALGILALVIFV